MANPQLMSYNCKNAAIFITNFRKKEEETVVSI